MTLREPRTPRPTGGRATTLRFGASAPEHEPGREHAGQPNPIRPERPFQRHPNPNRPSSPLHTGQRRNRPHAARVDVESSSLITRSEKRPVQRFDGRYGDHRVTIYVEAAGATRSAIRLKQHLPYSLSKRPCFLRVRAESSAKVPGQRFDGALRKYRPNSRRCYQCKRILGGRTGICSGMALLEDMPVITAKPEELRQWGDKWLVNKAFSKKEGMDFGGIFDKQVGAALAVMLGGAKVVAPNQQSLLPKEPDVVEVGPVRVVGGIRPQNYDVGYRPDGIRFAFDSKTLNDTSSVGKNFQNMINDLGTEATTVHTRFPYAVVGFMVVIPAPCFTGEIRTRFTRQLDRLVGRDSPIDLAHKAEAVSLVIWDPTAGAVDETWPPQGSPLRVEQFSQQIQEQYQDRYDGMPPHDKPSKAQKKALKARGEELRELEPAKNDDNNTTGD